MKIEYIKEVDVLKIILNDNEIEESDELEAGIIADYDSEGKIVAFEILDASLRTEFPDKVEYEMVG